MQPGSLLGPMSATNTARIANDSPFCEADAVMDKVKERLLAMLGTGAGLGEVTQLMATCCCRASSMEIEA